jgi:hypothetical protein
MKYLVLILSTIFLIGCGGGSGGSSSSNTANVGTFLDAPVEGVEYSSSANNEVKTTDSKGHFYYHDQELITFKVGQVILGEVIPDKTNGVITPLELVGTNDINN